MITRYVRFRTDADYGWGVLRDDETILAVAGDPLVGTSPRTDRALSRSDVELLVPATPSKIVGVGLNYARHAAESNKALPDEPLLFLKPPSALIATEQAIVLPDTSRLVHHEAELAIVMATRCRGLDPAQAASAILGFTAANDVSDRTLQRRDGQFTRGKGFDTFCPIGPTIATDIDADDLAIRCIVNGEVRQSSRTSDMVFDVATIVAFVSSVMTLEPWDIILTGTPQGVGALAPGDRVEVELEGVGRLSNPVILTDVPRGELTHSRRA